MIGRPLSRVYKSTLTCSRLWFPVPLPAARCVHEGEQGLFDQAEETRLVRGGPLDVIDNKELAGALGAREC